MQTNSSMTLTGLASGIVSSLSGRSGTISYTSSVQGTSGYGLSTGTTSQGDDFQIVSVSGSTNADDPATVIVEVLYKQGDSFDEVDLEARYEGMPDDTDLAVESSDAPEFKISRITLPDQSGLESAIATNVTPFTSTLTLKLWISDVDGLTRSSSVSLDMYAVDTGGGGPVQKTLLAKIEVKLG